MRKILIIGLAMAVVLLSGCLAPSNVTTPTPTETYIVTTPTVTETPYVIATPTATMTPYVTATMYPTGTVTGTPVANATVTVTYMPEATITAIMTGGAPAGQTTETPVNETVAATVVGSTY